jgi:hypothetical protein
MNGFNGFADKISIVWAKMAIQREPIEFFRDL